MLVGMNQCPTLVALGSISVWGEVFLVVLF